MLRLTPEQYDEAIELTTKVLAGADLMGLKTKTSRAILVVEALGDRFDVSPIRHLSVFRGDLPEANDEADAFLTDLQERMDEQRANGLLDWSQGARP